MPRNGLLVAVALCGGGLALRWLDLELRARFIWLYHIIRPVQADLAVGTVSLLSHLMTANGELKNSNVLVAATRVMAKTLTIKVRQGEARQGHMRRPPHAPEKTPPALSGST